MAWSRGEAWIIRDREATAMSHAAYAREVLTRWELPDRRLPRLHHRPAVRGHHLRPGPAGTPSRRAGAHLLRPVWHRHLRGHTILHLTELHDSVERACRLAARSQWDRKAAAHAEIFRLLADVLNYPLLTGDAAYMRDVMLTVGRAADGMIVSSRRRLLAQLRVGDSEGAALEMERHLRGLLFMWRLALPSGKAAMSGAVT